MCKGLGSVVDFGKDAGETLKNVGEGALDAGKDAGETLKNVGEGALDAGKDAINGLKDVFGRRKKRSTTISRQKRATLDCGALKKVKLPFSVTDALKGLKPKFAGDIKGIKNKVTEAFKITVEIIKTIISVCKKIFYLATLLLMMYDGYK